MENDLENIWLLSKIMQLSFVVSWCVTDQMFPHREFLSVRYSSEVLNTSSRPIYRWLTWCKHININIYNQARTLWYKCTAYLISPQDVEPAAFSAAVSHFLNCLLSSCVPDSCSDELLTRRRSRRKKTHGSRVPSVTDSGWARLTPSELWGKIKTEAGDYYHYAFEKYVCVCL